MSLPEPRRGIVALAACLAAGLALGGCTVRPLYATVGDPAIERPGAAAGLRSIAIPPVNTRYGQQVRNQLIFLFNGGAGQPAQPVYTMALAVSEVLEDTNVVSVPNNSRATSGTVRLFAIYTLTDSAGKPVMTGTRNVFASFDRSTQEFAVPRARIDAETRAARELAELVSLDVGQKLARRQH